MTATESAPILDIESFVPASLRSLVDSRRDLGIAKDSELVEQIESSLLTFPTHHGLALQDARVALTRFR